MPLLAYPAWKPDISDYEGQSSQTINNVIPRADGYGPFSDFTSLSAALPAASRGGFIAYKTDGTVAIFGATSTKLYLMSNTDLSWSDVSKGAGSYSAVSSTEQWRFAQFGNFVFAVQANTVPQVYDLTSSSAFADLAGSPPQARYIDIVGRFVVLSGLLSNPYRIQWSGLNDTTNWTSGINSSDFQDLPDGGIVRGVAGGESGVIFQDQSIRRMTYAPGSPVVFQIERLAQDKGLYAPYSLIRAGEQIFFLAGQGFYQIQPGGLPEPIGKEVVDRTFLADLDAGSLQLLIGAADPRSTKVYWAYKSNNGVAGNYDKILSYDYILQRFAPISMMGEYLLGISQPGLTLESLDSISSSIDALTSSLDSYPNSTKPEIASFGTNHKLGFFRGSNIEATLVTPEQGTDGQRIFVRNMRPITDAPTVYGSASARETQQATAVYSTESLIDARGFCPQRVSTRYSRLRVRIPAATVWTYAAGVEPDFVLEGTR